MSPPTHPSNRVAMLLSVVPGLSHVYLDHILLGAGLFAVFVTALNAVFLGANLQSANTFLLYRFGLLALVAVWVGSALHAYALSYGTDRSGLARDRGQLVRDALLDYLRNDLEAAALKLERAIELDVDWQDPDPLFHLGVVMLRLAEERALDQDSEGTRAARRRSQWAFRTCLGRDRFGKWRREIRRETTRMRSLLERTGRGHLTQSERLLRSDTTIAGFPELRESGTLPRLGSGSLPAPSGGYPRTRLTPRPFSRTKLAGRLDDTTLEPPAPDAAEPTPPAAEAPAAGEPLDRTRPAERPLPGEGAASGGGLPETQRDGRAGASLPGEDEPLPPEGAIPATRLDVRPQDLIPGLIPRTRQGARPAGEDVEAGPPPTRHLARPSLPTPEFDLPPTRSLSRLKVAPLGAGTPEGGDEDEDDGILLPDLDVPVATGLGPAPRATGSGLELPPTRRSPRAGPGEAGSVEPGAGLEGGGAGEESPAALAPPASQLEVAPEAGAPGDEEPEGAEAGAEATEAPEPEVEAEEPGAEEAAQPEAAQPETEPGEVLEGALAEAPPRLESEAPSGEAPAPSVTPSPEREGG